ncbi:Hypothetical protein YALI2_B00167g [Yarrowia lipolytica]|nr:Hypothetical protein YALI2_B00167g [Yarrowia lipolytica]
MLPPDSLAKRYGADKEPLIKSCFTKVDHTNQFLESYITHVSSHRGLTSPSARVIIAVRKNSPVRSTSQSANNVPSMEQTGVSQSKSLDNVAADA